MGTLSKLPQPGQTAAVIPVKESNRVYDLHEYDPDKLITGAINPDKIDSVSYPTYTKNANGIAVIDKNKTEVATQRTVINLNSVKTSSKKFNEVVDTEIQEFTEILNSNTAFLSNQVSALDSSVQRSRADNANLQKKINDLNSEIESLRNQLANTPPPISDNEVGDTLSAGKFLWNDRQGRPGDAGYPKIENMLLSKNRTARAVIYPGGDFVISTGKFNERGEPLEPEVKIFTKGWDNSGANQTPPLNPNNSRAFVWIYSNLQGGGQLEVGRTANNFWKVNWGSGRQTITSAARVQLNDAGVLNLFDGPNLIWSSYGA